MSWSMMEKMLPEYAGFLAARCPHDAEARALLALGLGVFLDGGRFHLGLPTRIYCLPDILSAFPHQA